MGAAIGAMAGVVMEQETHRQFVHDEVLDEEIGVIDGVMGAADPKAPPARIGAFSSAAAGGGTVVEDAAFAEGPFMPPDGA